jgi:hypothetical protein
MDPFRSRLRITDFPNVEAYAKARIEELINYGRLRAKQVVEYVQSLQPVDRIVKIPKLVFKVDEQQQRLVVKLPGTKDKRETTYELLHRNALQQAATKAGIPMAFADKLMGTDWGRELLAENFTEIFHHVDEKALLRSVGTEVRGFLSDRYRRLDSRPLVDAFARVCAEVGALPFEGYVCDTKVALQAIIPKVYEPIPGEYMAYGVNFENSDFGNGALNVVSFLLRLRCRNGAIGGDPMRRVHLGKRLDEEVEYSQETYDLDQKTTVSALQDVVRANLDTSRIETMQGVIRKAAEQELTDDRRKNVVELLKKYMTKEEIERANKKFNEPDVELLPAGNSMWRMSNAISWLAGEVENEERKIELQKVAGRLLPEMPKLQQAA